MGERDILIRFVFARKEKHARLNARCSEYWYRKVVHLFLAFFFASRNALCAQVDFCGNFGFQQKELKSSGRLRFAFAILLSDLDDLCDTSAERQKGRSAESLLMRQMLSELPGWDVLSQIILM